MYQEILALFSSEGAVAAAIGVLVAVVVKSISMLNQIMEFHDKHFIEKRYKLLKELTSGIPVNSKLKRYLDDSVELEAFRIVSGIRGSSLQIAALVKLDSLGYWNREQIRRVAKFLVIKPEDPCPSIKITEADKFGARFGLGMAILLLLAGGVISIALTIKVPPFGFFIGLAILAVMTWAGAYFAADHGAYRTARSVQKYLIDHPDTLTACKLGNDAQPVDAAERDVQTTA
ncbi:hypothetical protein [Pseudomonas frederiksbergensis]|uniref:hypothetical protein n=1 Tax=Pseudomonas frederiksbergensis TaxID=104087 RepID=UPI003D1EEE37